MGPQEEKPSRLEFISALQTLANHGQIGQLAAIYRITTGENKELTKSAIYQAVQTRKSSQLLELLLEEGLPRSIRDEAKRRLKILTDEASKTARRVERSLEALEKAKKEGRFQAVNKVLKRYYYGIEYEAPMEEQTRGIVESISKLPDDMMRLKRERQWMFARMSALRDSAMRTTWISNRIAISQAIGVVEKYLSGEVKIDLVDREMKIKGRSLSVQDRRPRTLKS